MSSSGENQEAVSQPGIKDRLLRGVMWLLSYIAVTALSVATLALSALRFPINFVALWVIETPLIYYLSMPICRLLGIFDYLSAYTILYGSKRKGKLAVHFGMSHDLIWRLLPKRKSGEKLIQTLRRDISAGMVNLCDHIEQGKIRPDAKISVGSYFLNPRKLERLGMQSHGKSFNNAVNFLFAYPTIVLEQLLLNGRIKWFNPFTVVTFTTTASELVKHRAYFERRMGMTVERLI